MKASTKKNFRTAYFENAHGRKPRGFGAWPFIRYEDNIAASAVGDFDRAIVWKTGTYTEAKRALPAGDWIVLS